VQQKSQGPKDNRYEKLSEQEYRRNRRREERKQRKQSSPSPKQVGSLKQQKTPQSKITTGDFALLHLEKATPRRKRRSSKYRDIEKTSSVRGLRFRRGLATKYKVRRAALILAAFLFLWLIVSSVAKLFHRDPVPVAQASSELVKNLPITPLLPPDIPPTTKAFFLPKPTNPTRQEAELVYNVTTPPTLQPSPKLQAVVDEMLQTIQQRQLPTEPLSITLINVKTGETAGFQPNLLKYPASVIKMFWMVNVFEQLERGILPNEPDFAADLNRMIQQSSNDAASRLVDAATGTESGYILRGEKYEDWANKRRKISEFFQKAGYEGIALHQKTYPIYYLNNTKPEGRDEQMWNDSKDVRNQISSEHAARLMYEIITKKSVSPEVSEKMIHLLAKDLRPEYWRENSSRFGGFNPIKGHLGQGLPTEVDFASKAGWTDTGRHEVAFVRSRENDGPVYIVAILGADEAYSKDWQLFPILSKTVFDRMSGKPREQK